jgi:hypothetical protein
MEAIIAGLIARLCVSPDNRRDWSCAAWRAPQRRIAIELQVFEFDDGCGHVRVLDGTQLIPEPHVVLPSVVGGGRDPALHPAVEYRRRAQVLRRALHRVECALDHRGIGGDEALAQVRNGGENALAGRRAVEEILSAFGNRKQCAVRMHRHARAGRTCIGAEAVGLGRIQRIGRRLVCVAAENAASVDGGARDSHHFLHEAVHLGKHTGGSRSIERAGDAPRAQRLHALEELAGTGESVGRQVGFQFVGAEVTAHLIVLRQFGARAQQVPDLVRVVRGGLDAPAGRDLALYAIEPLPDPVDAEQKLLAGRVNATNHCRPPVIGAGR